MMKRVIQAAILTAALLILAGLPAPANAQAVCAGSYRVVRGDTLNKIAKRCQITLSALIMANPQIKNPNRIYRGQTIHMPRKAEPLNPDTPTQVIRPQEDWLTREDFDQLRIKADSQEHWIDVDLSSQTVSAYRGREEVRTFLVSTGTWRTPTVTGKYRIYHKYETDDMRGPGYYLKDVPYTMYFHKGYGLHGTYWHDNFGQPMSHGCINLTVEDAKWLFEFASVGTLVNIRH